MGVMDCAKCGKELTDKDVVIVHEKKIYHEDCLEELRDKLRFEEAKETLKGLEFDEQELKDLCDGSGPNRYYVVNQLISAWERNKPWLLIFNTNDHEYMIETHDHIEDVKTSVVETISEDSGWWPEDLFFKGIKKDFHVRTTVEVDM